MRGTMRRKNGTVKIRYFVVRYTFLRHVIGQSILRDSTEYYTLNLDYFSVCVTIFELRMQVACNCHKMLKTPYMRVLILGSF